MMNTTSSIVFWSEEMNDDQPILDADDQFETDEYEGLLDLDFMAQIDVHLSVVNPDAYSGVEIPQGTNRDIESDDHHLNPRKITASCSRE